MRDAQYFHKVKSLCRKISELDPQVPIQETRMKRIVIHDLKSEYKDQPSLIEFENLLIRQEALAKQMGGASLKCKEEALYVNKGSRNFKQYTMTVQLQYCFSNNRSLLVIGGIKKLNHDNYNTWSICMMSYMQGQDL
ncbi:hypothetical protein SADUNF_Sadunf19G0102500 [Salix dunnii]|uniref:DUF4219 domain-containing protein n=1 Tax=Salix dunnii TaxID=1413687 RepID=A0A835J495_9ROSI|nr:hypothetical protein SADUNF_Sadunf19G0102500 [Salix dunnii]